MFLLIGAAAAIRHGTGGHRSPSSSAAVAHSETVTVPDLIHRPKHAAIQIAENRGFIVRLTEGQHGAAPAGTVFSEDPPAGTTITRGSALALIVSR